VFEVEELEVMADPTPEFDTAIDTDSPVTVLNNDSARLMHYLDCKYRILCLDLI